jgi:two-component system invasion response regulator UvrY
MLQSKTIINIAIVDDHNLFRKGLIKLINIGDKEGKYNILFEAENGNDLIAKLNHSKLEPDIILMDIDMPDMDGYETVSWLKKHLPDIYILVVSMFESSEHIIRMLKLGVNGYLSKDIEVGDMHTALESIISRGSYYSDFIASIMADELKNNDFKDINDAEDGTNLSEKEREFIKLACTDLSYIQIAEKMYMSPKTIDGYRETLFKRFNVKNRIGLAMFAIRKGLVKV